MSSKLLSARNISKTFGGVHALKSVDFEVAAAEIHCLCGENGSGKSTFVKTVAGVYTPDSGEIVFNGHTYTKIGVREAIKEGVQVIYQDLSLFSQMSVAENIAINMMVGENRKYVNWSNIYELAEMQLNRIGVPMDLKAPIENMSVANQQLVAICRALSMDAKLLFMDEPTTALTKHEVDRLLSIVLELKARGISVVFISHKLDEVMEVADSVSVFRDGEKVGDFSSKDIDEHSLSYYMTGRKVEYPRYQRKITDDKPVLSLKNLTKKGHYENVSMEIRKGDIVGLIGLLGAGRTELALSLFGLNPHDSGSVWVEGETHCFTSPKQAINAGISLVPENRKTQGCFLEKDIIDNVSSAILDKIRRRFGVIDREYQKNLGKEMIEKLKVVALDTGTKVANLSGGNAQKVVLGKWIATRPKILILDSPTVGVDIGSKAEIYENIQKLADSGMGILMISDELPELMANCNKLYVMRKGRIAGEYGSDEPLTHDVAANVNAIINADE